MRFLHKYTELHFTVLLNLCKTGNNLFKACWPNGVGPPCDHTVFKLQRDTILKSKLISNSVSLITETRAQALRPFYTCY